MFKNLITVFTGVGLAHFIYYTTFIFLPYFYSPQDIAILYTMVMFLGLTNAFATLSYEHAIIVAGERRHLISIIQICLILVFACSLFFQQFSSALFALLGKDFFQMEKVLESVGAFVFVYGIWQIVFQLPVRMKSYKLYGLAKVMQNTVFAVFAFLYSYNIGKGSPTIFWGLIIGDALGRLASIILISSQLLTHKFKNICVIRFSDITLVAREFKKFPLYVFPGSVIGSAVSLAIPLVISFLFGLSLAGQFALAERLLIAPVGAVGMAVSQLVNAELGESIRNANLAKFRSSIKRFFYVATPVGLIGVITGWALLELVDLSVFGPEYGSVGTLIKFLLPAAFVSFLFAPLNMVITLCQRSEIQLMWDISRALVYGGVFWCAHLFQLNFEQFIIFLSFAHCMVYGMHIVITWFLVNHVANLSVSEGL